MSVTEHWTLRTLPALDAPTAAAVRRLLDDATAHDGVAALSEHSLLHLEPPGSRHVLAYAVDAAQADPVGYAQVWDDGSAELVVAPVARRRGLGTALWSAAVDGGARRVWAHGDLEAARDLARALGLEAARALHLMGRPLTADDAAPVDLPDGITVETYADRQDPLEWVALNAAAFAGHPEQGRLTEADFATRAASPWFDPAGLIYLLDADQAPTGPPVAFHWTKVETVAGGGPARPEAGAAGDEGTGPEREGEVYAVGVHPAYQGRGLAAPLTRLGIAHLARQGLDRVVLYVDGDNERALRTYRATGFTDLAVDVVYAPGPDAVRMGA